MSILEDTDYDRLTSSDVSEDYDHTSTSLAHADLSSDYDGDHNTMSPVDIVHDMKSLESDNNDSHVEIFQKVNSINKEIDTDKLETLQASLINNINGLIKSNDIFIDFLKAKKQVVDKVM